jgi:hypothetical protein
LRPIAQFTRAVGVPFMIHFSHSSNIIKPPVWEM